jgi:hypothetical protein
MSAEIRLNSACSDFKHMYVQNYATPTNQYSKNEQENGINEGGIVPPLKLNQVDAEEKEVEERA